jgi:hypothetical protein
MYITSNQSEKKLNVGFDEIQSNLILGGDNAISK